SSSRERRRSCSSPRSDRRQTRPTPVVFDGSQPLGEDAQDLLGDGREPAYQGLKGGAVEDEQAARQLGGHRRRPFSAVQEGHFPEALTGADGADLFFSHRRPRQPFGEYEELIAVFTLN